MKEIYFVTATNTNIGKTYACEIFLKKFSAQGKKVGYFKPIETGVLDNPADGTKLLTLAKQLNPNFSVTINDIVPYQFELPASPYVAKANTEISIQKIQEKKDYLLKFCDILIIEGAGGLMVPIEVNYFMADLIKDLKVDMTYLITSSKLGSINDTLLSIKLLQDKKIPFLWFINKYLDKESFTSITLPYYKAYFDTIRFL